LLLKSAALPSKCALVYAPMCCCVSVTCSGNCASVSRIKYIIVSYNVVGCVLTCSAGWFLLRVACTELALSCMCVLLSSVQFLQCFKYWIACIKVCHSHVICLCLFYIRGIFLMC
jgi:hypothetical protein